MTSFIKLASFDDIAPEEDDFRADVLKSLSAEPKTLPCKYFYDERGMDLFNRICEQPEYYVTRTETALLAECAPDIADAIGPHCRLIEYGTGSSDKMRLLLNALRDPVAFIAVDISREHLLRTTAALAQDRADLEVHAVCADFSKPFALPVSESKARGKAVVFFPGSSLGNFDHNQSVAFLKNAADVVGPDGGLAIGIDLKKDESLLNAAYDDAAGVTAAFNKNLLVRINTELGGTFDLDAFDHRAFYNAAQGRVEMHLVSRREQTADVAGKTYRFREGETIHTESSYKYTVPEFRDLARKAGFEPVRVWTDRDGLFSIHYLETAA